MAASNLAYFMKKYYPDAEKMVFASLRKSGFNLTDNSLAGNKEIDLRICFGY
ncbi:hypothetical protein KY306_02060 [Candidatus Woesearchaeota archaeon]|nr:hypothetical protein [Candidatus Woesearchaeota archaeon]